MKKYLLRVAALVSFCPVVIIPYMVNAVDFGCQGGTCTNSWRGWTYVSGHAGYSAPTAPDWIKCYTSGPSSGSGGTSTVLPSLFSMSALTNAWQSSENFLTSWESYFNIWWHEVHS